jgi:hypothetical protein
MKIHLLTIVIIILLSGCASIRNDINSEKLAKDKVEAVKKPDPKLDQKIAELEQLNEWFAYPMAQNRLQKTGSPIKQPYSRGGIYFEIYFDESEVKNYIYYDLKLRDDIQRRGQHVKEQILYINPALKVSIYYYPRRDGEFDVFKVRIKKEEPVSEPVKTEPAKTDNTKPKNAKK